jgi:hypothetical protein
VFGFSEWTESIGDCGPFVYSATLNPTGVLPTYITFNPSLRQITVDSSTLTGSNQVISVLVTGVLGSYGTSTIAFTINVIDPCLTAVITPSTLLN